MWLGMPELTPHIMAYYYNANIRRNGGKLDAVFNIKNVPGRRVEHSGPRLRNEPGGRDRTESLANRRLHRRLALQPVAFSRITGTGRPSRWFNFLSTWSARTATCC